MPLVKQVLIVAPDAEFSRSLEFVLEAEGYMITAKPDLEAALSLRDAHFDCTVLDQAAAAGPAMDVIHFCGVARPVILLSNTSLPWLSNWVAGVVEKPMLGQALAAAVRRAVVSGTNLEPPK
ncbi:MAG: hypothetical protein ACYC0C_11315 [Devosia sp.]